MSKLEGSIRYPLCTTSGETFPAGNGLVYSGEGRVYINAAPILNAAGAVQIGVLPVDIQSHIVQKDPTGECDFVLVERNKGTKK